MGRRTRSILKRMARVDKVVSYYDLEVQSIDRSGNQIRLETPQGPMTISPAKRDEGFMIFLFSVQQHLRVNGFDQFRAIYQSKDAYPYVKYRGETLILEKEMRGEPFTFTRENVVKALETLARFHRVARNLNPMPGSEFKVSWGKWPDRCFNEVNDLVKQKLALRERRVTSFDEKFWEQVDHLIERGLMAWQRFNHEDYRRVLKREMEDRAFNLHNCKGEHLMMVDGRVTFASMDRIRFELQVYDLATFLDDVLKNSDIGPEELAGYVEHYTQIRPLSAEEREALLAFLLYPKGLFRLIRHYYKNRRVKDGLERFDEFVQLMEREKALVEALSQEKLE